jgi:hypothetical protein
MSDTPETDAQQLVQSVTGATLHCVDLEFARKLERDLRKARDTVLKLRKHRAIARRFGEQMERERDEERTITFRQADAIEDLERECEDLKKRLNGVLNALNEASK